MKLLAVGTRNPIKIAAVSNVLARIFRNEFQVVQVDVGSGVPRQPIGLAQTVLGAVNRARQAKKVVSGAVYGVGIEAGLTKVPKTITGYFDIQFAAVIDCKNRVTIGCGSGFEYPPKVLNDVLRSDKEIGEVMEVLSGIKDIGERMGAIGYLSHGELDRCTLTEQAVLMAFIPRINEKLYFESSKKGGLG
jgi:inosine/xanthosine triphosphatase